MRRISIAIWIVFLAGCNASKNGSDSGTSMEGTWAVNGSLDSLNGAGTFQLALVPSPCSVTNAVGTFSVEGPICFVANNYSGKGSISGTGLPGSSKNIGEGVLIGVPSNPVHPNTPFHLLFVLGDRNGNVVEFTGSGTVGNGTITGVGSCSATTPICQGVNGTFSGKKQ
jgi:hypothetical protein